MNAGGEGEVEYDTATIAAVAELIGVSPELLEELLASGKDGHWSIQCQAHVAGWGGSPRQCSRGGARANGGPFYCWQHHDNPIEAIETLAWRLDANGLKRAGLVLVDRAADLKAVADEDEQRHFDHVIANLFAVTDDLGADING